VKLGLENRKQVIALAVLGAIALVFVVRWLWPSEPQASASAAQTATVSSTNTNSRRTAFGKAIALNEPRLDPTLDLAMLRKSEEIKYTGNGRNIFVAGAPQIEQVKGPVVTDQATIKAPPPPPPPPPINLKFFGFASKPGEPKKIFLQQGDDVFVAGEGEIVDRRYRVLRISPASVEVEDVLNNNKQSIPLTLG